MRKNTSHRIKKRLKLTPEKVHRMKSFLLKYNALSTH